MSVCPSCKSVNVVLSEKGLKCLDEDVNFKFSLDFNGLAEKMRKLCKECKVDKYEKCLGCKVYQSINKMVILGDRK